MIEEAFRGGALVLPDGLTHTMIGDGRLRKLRPDRRARPDAGPPWRITTAWGELANNQPANAVGTLEEPPA